MAKQGEPSETMAIAEGAMIQPSTPANNFDIFELFLDLPPELRSMVIKAACFVPRNVSLWQKHHHNIPIPTRGRGPDIFAHSYKTTSRAPAILHVSKEFRNEGLRWYDLSFGTDMGTGDVRFVDPPKI